MHSWEDIEENICFSNGGTNLHIHSIAQGRPEDNQVEFLQGSHGIEKPPKKPCTYQEQEQARTRSLFLTPIQSHSYIIQINQ